ncbi:uncharacterized protein F5891DRAFT_1019648 [Suillus fuscotomentosus]|uniref:Mid2 domain-containing protein n=1 Tax=Suillus fuscotomentosus TaxID=1912939 RepID=A0AAD4EC00_9AGAM|nr:uncharacterized protein F5891DRAFT_1019648 [Suillus fuscotomentosus]KAG1903473.1 hypothetical protein F5891DRAFT_1019648 [Suillus fuscotomentosus]
MQGLAWVAPLLLYHAVVVLAAGNTTCLSSQLDWYTTAVGETPCMTYQRLRQICNSAYVVGDFSATTPGDRCNDQVSDCCCNSVAFALSMLCMNCQEDAVAGDVAGIDAAPGTYTTYLATCGASTNQSLPAGIQQAVCNENIKIDNFLYNRSYWSDGSCRWTADYAVEQQAINNNNTFTVCPNQVSPSASLPTSTTAPTAGGSPTSTIIASALHTSSGNTNSVSSTSTSTSRTAIIGGAVGGVALTIIAVLGGVYCYRRGKRPRMIQDTPSVFLGQSYGDQPVYGASFTDTEAVATQRYSSLSPARRHHESRESTLPVIHSLTPERVQSLNPSIGPSYLVNDDFSEVVPYIREDDAGTLIPPHDAPAERLPPAYHPSWVARNARPSSSDPGEDEVLLDQTVQTVWPSNETRPESTTGVPQEKIVSRWSTGS